MAGLANCSVIMVNLAEATGRSCHCITGIYYYRPKVNLLVFRRLTYRHWGNSLIRFLLYKLNTEQYFCCTPFQATFSFTEVVKLNF